MSAPKKPAAKPAAVTTTDANGGDARSEAGAVAAVGEERRGLPSATGTRRESEDRRAFWRPTPDRRREATERGRRAGERS